MNTLHSHYKMILSKCELLFFFTFTINFSSAATICKQHTERAEREQTRGGVAWGSDGKTVGRSQSADCCRLEGSRGRSSQLKSVEHS